MLTSKPYTQIRINRNTVIREFLSTAPNDELVWHQDRRHRKVRVIESGGWHLQMDEGLPLELVEGHTYNIPARRWHRVIRGSGKLRIEITEEKGKMKITNENLRSMIRKEVIREMAAGGGYYSSYASDGELTKYIKAIGAQQVLELYLKMRETTRTPDHAVRLTLLELERMYPEVR